MRVLTLVRMGMKFGLVSGLVAVSMSSATLSSPTEIKYEETSRTLYLDNGTMRVGIDKDWGGAIRELWYQGVNLINNHDGGRLAGISVYDGGDTYNNSNINDPVNWGWNPTPSDKYSHLNRPITYTFLGGTLYVKARNLHWNPDNKGGGRAKAIPSDLVVEMWLTFLSTVPTVLQARFRATHDGNDVHEVSGQEFPFTYINRGFDRVVVYRGSQPWSGDAPTVLPNPPNAALSATESWIAFVNAADQGLTLYAPYDYPFFFASAPDTSLPHEDDTNYLNPVVFHGYSPGESHETTVYYLVGRWQQARSIIQQLRPTLPTTDVLPPFGALDEPRAGATVGGLVSVAGWAIDNVAMARIEIFLNGKLLGNAQYGLPRPDVANVYPGLPGSPNFGFAFQFSSEPYPRGPHELKVQLIDQAGNTQRLGGRQVTFGNAPAFGSLDVATLQVIAGWAYDPDLGEDPVKVVIVIDDKDVATITADLDRPDLTGDPRIRGTRHGFSYPTPPLAVGSHTVHVYALDVPTGNRMELSGSPKTIVISK